MTHGGKTGMDKKIKTVNDFIKVHDSQQNVGVAKKIRELLQKEEKKEIMFDDLAKKIGLSQNELRPHIAKMTKLGIIKNTQNRIILKH